MDMQRSKRSLMVWMFLFIGMGSTEPLRAQTIALEEGLIGAYALDGDAEDGSEQQLHGRVYGTRPCPDRSGEARKALGFDKQSFVLFNHPMREIQQAVSVAIWVKTTRDSSLTLVSKYQVESGVGNGFMLTLADGKAAFSGRDGSAAFRTSGQSVKRVNDGAWHFLVGMCAGSRWEIWVDGEQEGVHTYDASGGTLANEVNLSLGNIPQVKPPFFLGEMDELRIYQRALNPGEIFLLYRQGQLTAREEIELRVAASMKRWEERGKFEKTEAYLARVNPTTRLQKREALLQAAIQALGAKRFDWQQVKHHYDPDAEAFLLKLEGFSSWTYPVPLEEAPLYDAHFHRMQVKELQFGLTEEGELEVRSMNLLPPAPLDR